MWTDRRSGGEHCQRLPGGRLHRCARRPWLRTRGGSSDAESRTMRPDPPDRPPSPQEADSPGLVAAFCAARSTASKVSETFTTFPHGRTGPIIESAGGPRRRPANRRRRSRLRRFLEQPPGSSHGRHSRVRGSQGSSAVSSAPRRAGRRPRVLPIGAAGPTVRLATSSRYDRYEGVGRLHPFCHDACRTKDVPCSSPFRPGARMPRPCWPR